MPIVVILYIAAVIFASAYVVAVKSSASYSVSLDYVAMPRKALCGLINCHALLVLLILSSLRAVCSSAVCGHLSVNRTALAMLLFIFVMHVIVQKFIIYELPCSGRELWLNYASCVLICAVLQLLWFATSIYAVIFCLDCLGALILLVIFGGSNRTGSAAAFSAITGVSVYIWVAFIASTMMLLSCSYLVTSISSVQLKNIMIFGLLLSKVSSSGEDLRLQFANFVVVAAVLLKIGVGCLFAWKRAFLKTLDTCGLVIYLVLYFGNSIVYAAHLASELSGVMKGSRFIVALIVALSLAAAVASPDKSTDVYSFFAWSSFFNTVFVFCAVLADSRSTVSVCGDALIKILWFEII